MEAGREGGREGGVEGRAVEAGRGCVCGREGVERDKFEGREGGRYR